MRPRLLVSLVLLLTAFAAPLLAEDCFATPELAARAAVGSVAAHAAAGGFRVQDVQVDAVMHRVWLRVRRCDDVAAPFIAVPVSAPLLSARVVAAQVPVSQIEPVDHGTLDASAAKPLLVHAGDSVRVIFASAAVHMELEGTADGPGVEGQTIPVTLKRRPGQTMDEPEHRIHGIVHADKSIEVQP